MHSTASYIHRQIRGGIRFTACRAQSHSSGHVCFGIFLHFLKKNANPRAGIIHLILFQTPVPRGAFPVTLPGILPLTPRGILPLTPQDILPLTPQDILPLTPRGGQPDYHQGRARPVRPFAAARSSFPRAFAAGRLRCAIFALHSAFHAHCGGGDPVSSKP